MMNHQQQGLRSLMRLETHQDIFSSPQTFMLGPGVNQFADGGWQTALARVLTLEDAEGGEAPRADIKQFSAASPEPHLAVLNAYAKLFAREAQLPDTALAVPKGPISDLMSPQEPAKLNRFRAQRLLSRAAVLT
jgi:DNA-binding transcriptional regulator YdaS (Cro superfamily)